MRKKHYLPRSFEKRVRWLNNFAKGFESIGPTLNFNEGEIQGVKNDAAMLNWSAKVQYAMRGTHKSFTAFKDMLNEGAARKEQLSVPTLPELPPAPAPVAPGIFIRTGKIVQRIKSARGYTEAMGLRLGVIGAEQKINLSTVRPQIKAKVVAGKLIIYWKKGVFTGIELHINRDDGKGFIKGTFYMRSPVKLDINLPSEQRTAMWQVMGYYKLGDITVGQPSAIVEVAVSR